MHQFAAEKIAGKRAAILASTAVVVYFARCFFTSSRRQGLSLELRAADLSAAIRISSEFLNRDVCGLHKLVGRLRRGGAGGFGEEAEVGEGFFGDFGLDDAFAGELREGCGDDGLGVDFEVAAEVLAVVGAAEAVGAERAEAASRARGEGVGQGLHVVAGGDDGAGGVAERRDDVGDALLGGGVQAVEALGVEAVAAELVVAGDGPDVGGDVVLFGEDRLGFDGLVEDGAGAEELGLALGRLSEALNL